MEYLDTLKSFLDEIGIIYSDGPQPMNWTAILKEIRDNFESFLEDGGWKWLTNDVRYIFQFNL